MPTLRAPLRPSLRLAPCALALSLLPAAALGSIGWKSIPTRGAEGGVTAVALDAQRGRIALGTARGALAGTARGVFELVVPGSDIRDLSYACHTISPTAHCTLFAATDRGIYRIDPAERSGPRAAGPADGARDIQRIAPATGGAFALAVATSAGPYLSLDGRLWERLSNWHPNGPVTAIALRVLMAANPEAENRAGENASLECWTLAEGALWRTVVPAPGSSAGHRSARRETIPFGPRADAAIDVVSGIPGSDLVVLFPGALAVRVRVPGAREATWKIVRPTLPPGARIVRIASALGRIWLATDRGLLEAQALEGPWRRAASPAGTADARALAGDAHSLFVATNSGLLGAFLAEKAMPSSAVSVVAPAETFEVENPQPRIRELQRAAIAHLGLSRMRIDAMRGRVGRRGWLPVASLRGAHARDREWGTDRDQTFTSGATRHLVDADSEHARATDVSLTLVWDFGDIVFHPEEIDVSREMRALISLRDDVLDELTQLYFERRRALEQWARLPATSVEARSLRLRADELAAGMDAWTGGWFSRQIEDSSP